MIFQLTDTAELRANWIEMHIVDQSQQRAILVNEDRFVAPLEHMPTLITETVKTRRKRALQPFHALHQIWLRRLDHQMVVVAHDHIGIELPSTAPSRFKDRSLKRFPRLIVNKKVLTVVPAANDVVNRTRVFDPLFAWHEEEASRGAGDGSNLYILRLTPVEPRQMVRQLRRDGILVGRKRVQRLMRIVGLQAICPRPNTSKPHPEHKVYPYLLRNVPITRVDHVWSTDITYIPLQDGHVYLCAVIDWHSRDVISWSLSCSMDGPWCRSVLQEALMQGRPEVFNTDQGSQFTSPDYVKELISRDIKVSMDGRGRALDNVFVERLWRTVKYENVYLKGYEDMKRLKAGLKEYFEFYNHKRPHSLLDGSTTAEVYFAAEKDKDAA